MGSNGRLCLAIIALDQSQVFDIPFEDKFVPRNISDGFLANVLAQIALAQQRVKPPPVPSTPSAVPLPAVQPASTAQQHQQEQPQGRLGKQRAVAAVAASAGATEQAAAANQVPATVSHNAAPRPSVRGRMARAARDRPDALQAQPPLRCRAPRRLATQPEAQTATRQQSPVADAPAKVIAVPDPEVACFKWTQGAAVVLAGYMTGAGKACGNARRGSGVPTVIKRAVANLEIHNGVLRLGVPEAPLDDRVRTL